jgi:heat shock protein HslJ
MKTIFVIAIITGAIYLSSCSSSGNYSPKEYELNGAWELQNLGGTQATMSNWPNGLPWMSLKVNIGELKGNTGCNGMGGPVHATADMISFGNIISTRMYCEGVDEQGFLAALQNARNWTIENDRLFLYDAPGGVVLAVFREKVPNTEN